MGVRSQKPRPFCYWTEETGGDEDTIWRADCDELFQFYADGPKENGFKFCPYCGQPIKAK